LKIISSVSRINISIVIGIVSHNKVFISMKVKMGKWGKIKEEEI